MRRGWGKVGGRGDEPRAERLLPLVDEGMVRGYSKTLSRLETMYHEPKGWRKRKR